MIRGVHHIALSTPDPDRLSRFYCEHFGFAKGHAFDWEAGKSPAADRALGLTGSGATVRLLRKADFWLEIFHFQAPEQNPHNPTRGVHEFGYTHLCFYSDDVEADYRKMLAGGCQFHSEPMDRGIHKYVYLRDPDGNVVELLEIVAEDHPFGLPQD